MNTGRSLAQISDISYYLPSTTLGNQELSGVFAEWSQTKALRKLGIEERPIAGSDETALDMAVLAGERLFEQGKCQREEIDFVLLCTQSPDYFLPTSACLIQEKLGLPKKVGALDFNLGCSGYVYGLALCKGLIEAGMSRKVLFLTSETYSKYINKLDRTNRPLFGDGATATLVEAVKVNEMTERGPTNESHLEPLIGPFEFGTDGKGGKMLIVPAGAHRKPANAQTAIEHPDGRGGVRSQNQLYMDGAGIFIFAVDTVPPLVNDLLAQCGKTREDIDCFVFHQANRYMLDKLRDLCEIDPGKYFNDVMTRGNTVSSSIPIAIVDAYKSGMLRPGATVMLVGFGVGLSWGATLVKIPDHFSPKSY